MYLHVRNDVLYIKYIGVVVAGVGDGAWEVGRLSLDLALVGRQGLRYVLTPAGGLTVSRVGD